MKASKIMKREVRMVLFLFEDVSKQRAGTVEIVQQKNGFYYSSTPPNEQVHYLIVVHDHQSSCLFFKHKYRTQNAK